MKSTELAEKVLSGEPRAIARAITTVENHGEDAAALMKAVFPKTGNALIVGITGAPGAGNGPGFLLGGPHHLLKQAPDRRALRSRS